MPRASTSGWGPLQRRPDPPAAPAQPQLPHPRLASTRSRTTTSPTTTSSATRPARRSRSGPASYPAQPHPARGGRVPGALRLPADARERAHVRWLLLRQLHDVPELADARHLRPAGADRRRWRRQARRPKTFDRAWREGVFRELQHVAQADALGPDHRPQPGLPAPRDRRDLQRPGHRLLSPPT